ncbi:MFS transporter [Streptomyces sp. NBC_01476]|uniref:MFS transporter n=1 Tax=Streptomyces sp. NBC_01476 TaxID=2903881 RepID=UPI002E370856|nr:MFS transporter [Streptomyces sp. NBC_01476]
MTETTPPAFAPAAEKDSAAAARRGSARGSYRAGFWLVAAAFTALMAFGTAPTPLWPLYQVRDGFGATTVTVAFAVMVIGAAASLFAFGHLSDRVGRRPVVAFGLATAVASAVVFAVSPSLPSLIAGRVLTGIAIGLMAPTATAYLTDLYRQAHPERPGAAVPALVGAGANLGGLALGPLAAGALAQWASAPLTTVYVVFAAVLAVLLVVVLRCPETVDRSTAGHQRSVRFALRPGGRTSFGSAAAVGFFSFAVMGLFSSLGAIIVRGQLGITSTFVVGLAPFTAFAASAVAQLALAQVSHPRLLVSGTVLFPVGLALTALTLYHPALWLALVAAGLSGGGAGLLFKASVVQSVTSAEPASRAGVLAAFFVVAYLGMGLPSVAFSVVIQHAALRPSMIGFAAAISLGAGAAAAVGVRTHHHQSTLRPR